MDQLLIVVKTDILTPIGQVNFSPRICNFVDQQQQMLPMFIAEGFSCCGRQMRERVAEIFVDHIAADTQTIRNESQEGIGEE